MAVGRDASRAALAALLGVVACGPDRAESTWIAGTWSATQPTIGPTALEKYEIRGDGSATRLRMDGCGDRSQAEMLELAWEQSEGETIRLETADGDPIGGSFLAYSMSQGEDCNTLSYRAIEDDGPTESSSELYRGDVCLQVMEIDADCVECPWCEVVWCDGPPAACD